MTNIINVKVTALLLIAFLTGCNSESSESHPFENSPELASLYDAIEREAGFNEVYEKNESNDSMSTAQEVDFNSKIKGSFISSDRLDVDLYTFLCEEGISPKISIISFNDRKIFIKVFSENDGEIYTNIGVVSIKFDMLEDDQCYFLVSPLDYHYSEYEITLKTI